MYGTLYSLNFLSKLIRIAVIVQYFENYYEENNKCTNDPKSNEYFESILLLCKNYFLNKQSQCTQQKIVIFLYQKFI